MRFDWESFCKKHSVPFVTSGPNTARGHISIRCPYCGESDHSEHMGLSLDVNDPAWGCFRNAQHRGRNPRRLVQALLGIGFHDAQAIVDKQNVRAADEDELSQAISRLTDEGFISHEAKKEVQARPAFPPEFKPLLGRAYGKRFLEYMERRRGFPPEVLGDVVERYGLQYALTGDFAWRLIFPICEEDGSLAGWTGRDIRDNAWLRYRTTEQLPNRVVFNSHLAVRSEAETLVIVEGPVDAVKVDFFGRELGVSAVATLGTAVPSERKASLATLARRFKNVALLFDEGTLGEVLSLGPELSETSSANVALWRPGVKDPGEMKAEQLKEFLQEKLSTTMAAQVA